MISKMLFNQIWIFLFQFYLFFNPNDCKVFCEDPSIDSSLAYKQIVFLFSGDQYWIYRPKYNRVGPHSKTIVYEFEDSNIDRIDTIFMRTHLNSNLKNEYHLSAVQTNEVKNETNLKFTQLDSKNRTGIPLKWNISGLLSDWFPNNMDGALLLEDHLLIFHNSSIRYTYVNNKWPKEDEKIEIAFKGSLQNISKIDTIFECPVTKHIVIIVGLQYCQFIKNQINFNSINKLNISCEWKDTKQLFGCQQVITSEIESSILATLEPISSSGSTDFSNKSKSKTILLLIVLIFTVLILVIIGFVLLIAFIIKRVSDKKESDHLKRNDRMNRPIETTSLTSIATVDSKQMSLKTESTSQSN